MFGPSWGAGAGRPASGAPEHRHRTGGPNGGAATRGAEAPLLRRGAFRQFRQIGFVMDRWRCYEYMRGVFPFLQLCFEKNLNFFCFESIMKERTCFPDLSIVFLCSNIYLVSMRSDFREFYIFTLEKHI